MPAATWTTPTFAELIIDDDGFGAIGFETLWPRAGTRESGPQRRTPAVTGLSMSCMTHAPTSAVIYCRISADKLGEGLGVARQERLCRDLAERLGWPVGGVYVDNDISATSGRRRPRYEAMLSALADGTHDGLLCVDVDRLTQAPSELETLITLADRHGIALANVSGEFDLASSDGRLRARLLGVVARAEVEKSRNGRSGRTRMPPAGAC